LKFNFFRDSHELKDIAKQEPTDKVAHNYLDKYEFFLKDFKDRKFNTELTLTGVARRTKKTEYTSG